MDSKLRLELYQRGYIARQTFDRLIGGSREMAGSLALAKRIAKYPTPVLLTGEQGVGKGMLAQCIHNESLRRGNAFVPVHCGAWQAETLDTMLFGNYTAHRDSASLCMAEQARDGTLYLSHVDALPPETQYKVLNLILGLFLHNGPNQPVDTDVRVIAATDANLTAKVEKGEFRRDLYYALNILGIELPPLRQRRGDVQAWFDRYLAEWQERFNRHVRLTQGAQKFIQEYDWPGNLDQMNNLCERVVLLTEKRNVDEVFLKKQLELVSPRLLPGDRDGGALPRPEGRGIGRGAAEARRQSGKGRGGAGRQQDHPLAVHEKYASERIFPIKTESAPPNGRGRIRKFF